MACPEPLPPLMSTDDLATLLGVTFTEQEEAQAALYLRIISGFVRLYACDDMVDPDDPDAVCVPDVVLGIIFTAYSRAKDNPRGLTSERIADYTWQAAPAAGASNAGTGLYLSNGEAALIRQATGCGGMGTIEFGAYLPDQIRERPYRRRGNSWGRYSGDIV